MCSNPKPNAEFKTQTLRKSDGTQTHFMQKNTPWATRITKRTLKNEFILYPASELDTNEPQEQFLMMPFVHLDPRNA